MRHIVGTLYRSRWALMNSYAERTRPTRDFVDIGWPSAVNADAKTTIHQSLGTPLSCAGCEGGCTAAASRSMRFDLKCIVLVVTCVGLPACGTSATAPGQTGPLEFDPSALFAQLAGPYVLTFEADESCP